MGSLAFQENHILQSATTLIVRTSILVANTLIMDNDGIIGWEKIKISLLFRQGMREIGRILSKLLGQLGPME